MSRFNTAEFNPHNASIPSSDFFSFLDNEIYYIAALENSECSKFIKLNEESRIFTYDNFFRTKFLFRWKETGYVICTADNPSMVLTLKMDSEPGKFHITTERYQNRADQIWEILPHLSGSDPYGLSIRSASRQSGEHIYLGWDRYFLTASRGRKENTSMMLCPLSEWITFGMACMQYLGWIYVTDNDVKKTLKNYYSNVMTNITAENALLYNGVGLIVNQSGGNFKSLNYGDVYMNDVACEVIAVCNAIRLSTSDFDENNNDFFRISAEFELSGLYKNSFKKMIVNTGTALGIKKLSSISTSTGSWGGDPDKIGNCLEAHNIPFKKIHIKDQNSISRSKKSEAAMLLMDKEITDSICAVVSYNFDTLHQAIHTFACISVNDSVQTFNRYCDHTPYGNYLNSGLTENKKGIFKNITQSVSSEKDALFYVGYLIKK